ncbi:MAG TPA: DUF2271 domain-containing protein [Burkholderiaceae bacterium]|nr:DUF2271 domain-containing protein [Burkholderiaceae bacterium]
MKLTHGLALGSLTALIGVPAMAAELGLTIEIPRLNVAEYHRPYVALWIERADRTVAANLALWYDLKLKDAEGEKWLKDLRQWWRRSGRELDLPIDGLSGATRPPGSHRVSFGDDAGPVKDLAAGQYKLVVEAAREVGGRELLEIPFQWPPSAPAEGSAQGKSELGAVKLTLKP